LPSVQHSPQKGKQAEMGVANLETETEYDVNWKGEAPTIKIKFIWFVKLSIGRLGIPALKY